MLAMIELIQGGGVTSAKGFSAGGTFAGLKSEGDDVLDLGILLSDQPAVLAATFTTNSVESGSVTVSRRRAKRQSAQAVVANSGCANCLVGEQGIKDAEEMAALAAAHVGIKPDETLVCSTGIIGMELPMGLIRQNIGEIKVGTDGGERFARSIMTTDTRPKQIAISIESDGHRIIIGGAVKGAAMIHPNMATMLCFIATDARVEAGFFQDALAESVNSSFNMITVDRDQSTNDTVLALANGAAGGPVINAGSASADSFQEALTYVCIGLAKEIVRDAEGAERVIEVVVDGAKTLADARDAARGVAASVLVKAMVHGLDPNWGRVLAAIGNSSAEVVETKIDLFVNDIHIVHEGSAIPFFHEAVVSSMGVPEVRLRANLNIGDASATAWGCDLTEEYVTLNSAYST